jgi:hypothetical protein
MLDLDSFLISLYVLEEDWWKLEHSSEPPRAGRPALLTDPEVITLAILAQWPLASEASEISGALLRHIYAPPTSRSSAPKANSTAGCALCGARFAPLPTCSGPNALWRFGAQPCPGYYPHPGHGEGKSFSQGLFAGQATFGRSASKTEWVYGFKVALSVSPEGVICAFWLAEAASEERPIGDLLIIENFHDAYLADKGFTGVEWERRWLDLYGALVAATPKNDSKRAWAKTDRRWASGKRQINRRGNRPTKGPLRPGAPQGQDAGWAFGPLGGQDGSLHLWAAAQRPARATAAPPGRPLGLSSYASLVLGLSMAAYRSPMP